MKTLQALEAERLICIQIGGQKQTCTQRLESVTCISLSFSILLYVLQDYQRAPTEQK